MSSRKDCSSILPPVRESISKQHCIEWRDRRRTNVDRITLEVGPVERIVAELNGGPVDGEPLGPGGDANGVGVKDMADKSLVGGEHRLGDAGVEVVKLLYVFGRVGHSPLLAPEGAGNPVGISRAIGLMLVQSLDALLRRRDNLLQPTNPRLDLGNGVLEALFT